MKSISINDEVSVIGRANAIGRVVAKQEKRYLIKWKSGQTYSWKWLKRNQIEVPAGYLTVIEEGEKT